MKITVISPQNMEYEIETENSITVEQLVQKTGSKTPVLSALCEGRYLRLNECIDHDCTVECKDIRDSYANMSYQYSLGLLYRYAVHQLIPDGDIEMCNSLSKGIFTKIRGITPTRDLCTKITDVMTGAVKENMPLEETYLERDALLKKLNASGLKQSYDLVTGASEVKGGYVISLGNETDWCPVHVLPSCGYLSLFEVRRYRRGILLRFPDMNDPNAVAPFREQPVLYNAFAEQNRWEKLTEVSDVHELNDIVHTDKFNEMVLISDALHEKKIAEIASLIHDQGKRIILIAGPSSSGKTTFAMRLCIQLRVCGLQPLYLGTDDYFVNREDLYEVQNGNVDFEDLSAVDTALFEEQMNALLDGETVDLPSYDFVSGKKIFGKRITSLKEGQPIVIEGIHGLNPALTQMISDGLKLRIYISPLTGINLDDHHRIPTSDARFLRRMIRDNRSRDVSAEETLLRWHSVRKGEEKNIFPYSGYADVFFNTQCSYELPVLKKYAKPLLEEIDESSPVYGEARRILDFLAFFETADDDSVISNTSIIREFIGGSVLVK